ncbi:SseB family protein [Lachnospiraceae bacterium OF09-6]|nr:SseB family protein [Lachnospiraceae bacterium OF09-6]
MEKDQNLKGNEKIEESIWQLQKEPTQEMLAHALTVVRRRMKEGGHLIVAVDPSGAMDSLQIQTVQTGEGKLWFAAYTSFEEQMKGSNAVMSAFTAEIGKLFQMALRTEKIEGVILNPWNRTLMLNKNLIHIVVGTEQ